jgi:solute carrier family 50 (sugar transporter)
MWIYYIYSAVKPNQVYYLSLGCVLVSIWLWYCDNIMMVGYLGCGMSILVSGSPLAVIKTVLKDKSTAALPFWTSFAAWLNSLSWVLYGYFVIFDVMILLPNLLGLFLTSLQISLFIYYGFPKPVNVVASSGGFPHTIESPYNV